MRNLHAFWLPAFAFAVAPSLWAQASWEWRGVPFQAHGFFSQGFLYSTGNNFLPMETTRGSFAYTEGGLNLSAQLRPRLRVGAQLYVRRIGEFGRGRPEIDWAMADLRIRDWFALRAGKVKTVLGLHNDTQDMESLHPWALLPQSVYPLDLRSTNIAHIGGDIYGNFSPRRLGTFSYTVYGGRKPDDRQGGYAYALRQIGVDYARLGGHLEGADLRWSTPVPGLLVGASHMIQNVSGEGTLNPTFNRAAASAVGFPDLPTLQPISERTTNHFTSQFYVQWQRGPVQIEGEYQRSYRGIEFYGGDVTADFRSWYTSLSWRIHPRVSIGGYYSRFENWRAMTAAPGSVPRPGTPLTVAISDPANHIYDSVISTRVDLNRWWNVKVEGHFMDGYGSIDAVHGFYVTSNPGGLRPRTNLLMIRTGFRF